MPNTFPSQFFRTQCGRRCCLGSRCSIAILYLYGGLLSLLALVCLGGDSVECPEGIRDLVDTANDESYIISYQHYALRSKERKYVLDGIMIQKKFMRK